MAWGRCSRPNLSELRDPEHCLHGRPFQQASSPPLCEDVPEDSAESVWHSSRTGEGRKGEQNLVFQFLFLFREASRIS